MDIAKVAASTDLVAEDDVDRGWKARHVLGWGALVVVCALLLMAVWAWFLHSRFAPQGSAETGQFGDAYAPLTGLFTAMALGAAIVSVCMQRAELELQRKELREARREYELQSNALTEANTHATLGNQLQISAQLLEAARQIADVDRLGTERIQDTKDRRARVLPHAGSGPRADPIGDPAAAWSEFARVFVDERGRLPHVANVDSIELRALAGRKRELELTIDALKILSVPRS